MVIERDEKWAEGIAGEYDCLVLNADATTKETLVDGGAEQADGIISTTQHDATNITIILLVAVIGRSTMTTHMVAAYITVFAGYVIFLGLRT